MHGEVGDDVILVGHGLPLPVLLLHVLLQVEARLLGDVVLLEEGLEWREEGRKEERKGGREGGRSAVLSVFQLTVMEVGHINYVTELIISHSYY